MTCCCNDSDQGASPMAARRTWVQYAVGMMQWAAPITTLALVPKCPGCVAGYVLLLSGVGMSVAAAAAVRWGVIALSICVLAHLMVRAVRRRARARGGRA